MREVAGGGSSLGVARGILAGHADGVSALDLSLAGDTRRGWRVGSTAFGGWRVSGCGGAWRRPRGGSACDMGVEVRGEGVVMVVVGVNVADVVILLVGLVIGVEVEVLVSVVVGVVE